MPGGRDPSLQLLEECSSPDTTPDMLLLRDTTGSPCQVQHPHFTSKLTEAQRGEEAGCQDHTAEET